MLARNLYMEHSETGELAYSSFQISAFRVHSSPHCTHKYPSKDCLGLLRHLSRSIQWSSSGVLVQCYQTLCIPSENIVSEFSKGSLKGNVNSNVFSAKKAAKNHSFNTTNNPGQQPPPPHVGNLIINRQRYQVDIFNYCNNRIPNIWNHYFFIIK